MRHFNQLATGVDIQGLLHAIMRQPDLWNANTVRTHPEQSAHRSVDDIILRYNPFTPGDDFLDAVCSRIECEEYPAWFALPQARRLVLALMTQVEGVHLGRVFISRMKPGTCIPPHSDLIAPAHEAFPDRIEPARYFERYHIALKSNPGVMFRAGDEQCRMDAGTAWWFDNLVEHEVKNNGDDDRIHLVADIRSAR